ncbi:MAG TPA: tyrosine-type recombinase/integrase, partial [Syntrophales bacterium]|nr:tyrosine-type recombinase/integrase [Syntrophales bacterium]
LRIQEARAMMKDCVTDEEVIIKRSFSEFALRETTKTGRIRRFSLTSRARAILKSVTLSTCQFVFTPNNKTAYHPRLLNEIWHKACAAVGIKIKLYNAFRHSLGCQLLDEGQPLDLVRDVLGHSTSEMTRRYAKRNPTQLTNALENRGKVIPFRGHLEVQNQDVKP